jgi:hypothetical protein
MFPHDWKYKTMSEESSENVVQKQVTEEIVEVVVQPVEAIIEPTLPPVQTVIEPAQKKKRPRSEKQIKALENARKNKAAKRNNKPVKVERASSSSIEDPEYSFSWTKEIAKVSCLAALGLGTVFVQQQFAQNQKTQKVIAVDIKPTINEDNKPTLKRPKVSSEDPFGSYR